MLNQLKRKFVTIIMAIVAVVLATVFAGICYSEYRNEVEASNQALRESIDRSAAFEARSAANAAGGVQSSNPPEIGGGMRTGRFFAPAAVFKITDDGSVVSDEATASASLSADTLAAFSARATALDYGIGDLPDLGLRYAKETVNGITYLSLVDSSTVQGWQRIALQLSVAGIAALAVFLLVSIKLANWALRPVQEAWRAQKQFVADASHELKTPLTIILANSAILLKHPESTVAQQSKWIESTQIEAERMQGLTEEMLSLAEIEAQASIELSDVDLSDLIDREALQFESIAFERGCALDADTEEGVVVKADAQRLGKSIATLIENACKYVEAGGRVRIGLSSENGRAVLSVNNSGSYIERDDLEHIFDRFYRTDKARSGDATGYGLGLSIAKETAEAHGGTLSASSSREGGTTFTLTLPLA
ncbi:hypothetical protein JI75_03370 [Berryella intestinalis]|uniref:Sensor-like histidine kinase SenX3 n=1 Tax=Berryella intestinalis TaxID=1531429 RepID=A0A0A8B9M0_9ACTN|nr:HAMP domain-containing sensor histidine kinase [Berryella intestinalis]AJC11852.1 hypothetical protein JI75_03370 [Berryella intestinalis]